MMQFNTSGIIIGRRYSLENDKVVSIYTHDLGKVTGIAVGAKKINARFCPVVELLTEAEFSFVPTQSSLMKIVGARIIYSFPGIKSDYRKYLIACRVAEVIDRTVFENLKNEKKYNLLKRALSLIECSENYERIYIAFLLRFFSISGYKIDFFKCRKCNDQNIKTAYLSILEKGIVCEKCFSGLKEEKLDNKTLTFFRNLSKLSGEEIEKMAIPPETEKFIMKQCEMFLKEYIDKPLNSVRVSEQFEKYKQEHI